MILPVTNIVKKNDNCLNTFFVCIMCNLIFYSFKFNQLIWWHNPQLSNLIYFIINYSLFHSFLFAQIVVNRVKLIRLIEEVVGRFFPSLMLRCKKISKNFFSYFFSHLKNSLTTTIRTVADTC
jgi:hypothetical protein